jgi:hypothetical protein
MRESESQIVDQLLGKLVQSNEVRGSTQQTPESLQESLTEALKPSVENIQRKVIDVTKKEVRKQVNRRPIRASSSPRRQRKMFESKKAHRMSWRLITRCPDSKPRRKKQIYREGNGSGSAGSEDDHNQSDEILEELYLHREESDNRTAKSRRQRTRSRNSQPKKESSPPPPHSSSSSSPPSSDDEDPVSEDWDITEDELYQIIKENRSGGIPKKPYWKGESNSEVPGRNQFAVRMGISSTG